jgi:hypothetical protein
VLHYSLKKRVPLLYLPWYPSSLRFSICSELVTHDLLAVDNKPIARFSMSPLYWTPVSRLDSCCSQLRTALLSVSDVSCISRFTAYALHKRHRGIQGCMHRGNAVESPDASLQMVAVYTLCRFTANPSQTKASQYLSTTRCLLRRTEPIPFFNLFLPVADHSTYITVHYRL